VRPAGFRTTLAWHCRVSWRWLRTRAVLAQLALEEWWTRHIAAPDLWDDAMDELLAPPAAIPWVGPNWSRYLDGRSDIWVEEVGAGREGAMVDAYLRELTHISPRGILG
jgi:hypothetical protein